MPLLKIRFKSPVWTCNLPCPCGIWPLRIGILYDHAVFHTNAVRLGIRFAGSNIPRLRIPELGNIQGVSVSRAGSCSDIPVRFLHKPPEIQKKCRCSCSARCFGSRGLLSERMFAGVQALWGNNCMPGTDAAAAVRSADIPVFPQKRFWDRQSRYQFFSQVLRKQESTASVMKQRIPIFADDKKKFPLCYFNIDFYQRERY